MRNQRSGSQKDVSFNLNSGSATPGGGEKKNLVLGLIEQQTSGITQLGRNAVSNVINTMQGRAGDKMFQRASNKSASLFK